MTTPEPATVRALATTVLFKTVLFKTAFFNGQPWPPPSPDAGLVALRDQFFKRNLIDSPAPVVESVPPIS